jgi:hypothetical protein
MTDTVKTHLDAIRENGGLPVLSFSAHEVLFINGEFADAVGALGLQDLANEKGRIIAVEEPSSFHAGKLFRPA